MKFEPTSSSSGSDSSTATAPLWRWRKARADVRANVADARILFLGDSTTAGYGADDVRNSMPAVVSRILDRGHMRSTIGMVFPSSLSLAAPPDNRVTLGAGWTITTQQAFGGGFYRHDGVGAGTLSIGPFPDNADTLTVSSYRAGGHGTSPVNVDGGASLGNIVGNGAQAMIRTTFTIPAGTGHVVNIGPAAGAQLLIGSVELSLSTLKAALVCNGGRSGYQTANLVVDGGIPYAAVPMMAHVAPKLTVLNVGINDAGLSISTELYRSRLNQIVQLLQAAGSDVVLVTPVRSRLDPWASFERQYRSQVLSVANATGSRFVDIGGRWTDWTTANGRGLMSDDLHPSTAGYSDFAQAVADVIMAD